MNYRLKLPALEALSFEELAEHGRKQGVPCYGPQNLPWSFTYQGHAVTHENDDCYLVNLPHSTLRLTRSDILIVGDNELSSVTYELFTSLFEPVDGS